MGLLFAGRDRLRRGAVLAVHATPALRTIRRRHSRAALRWFDWHNLLGAVTIAWALVVGATGVINTWAEVMLSQWKATELADDGRALCRQAAAGAPGLAGRTLIARATQAAPGCMVAFVALPGTPFTSLASLRGLHARRHAADVAAVEAGAAGRRNRRGVR